MPHNALNTLRAHLAGTPQPEVRRVSAQQYHVTTPDRTHIFLDTPTGIRCAGSVPTARIRPAPRPQLRYNKQDTTPALDTSMPVQPRLL